MSTPSPVVVLTDTRIAVVNWRDLDHSLAGGSEYYAWELSRALVEAGARVEFVTARERGRARSEVRDGIEIRRGGGTFTFYAYASWSLLRRRRVLDAVVDPACGIPVFSPWWVRRSTPVLLVVHHVHQQQFATYFPGPVARFGQWLEKTAMPRVYRRAHTVAVSDSTRREMVEQLGWAGEVGLLENGSPAPADVEATEKDVDRVVVLGRLVPHKRVDLVLRALAVLRAERPGLRLDICGKGPELEPLRALADELGLGDHATFHGYVSEETKAAILRRAALHVCASDSEGWGQVVIEAAGFGIPTVARDVPGLRDSIRDGETGYLVAEPPAVGVEVDLDVVVVRLTDAIRAALVDLDEPEHRTLAVTATQNWAAGFSWQRMHREAVELVSTALITIPTGARPRFTTALAPTTER